MIGPVILTHARALLGAPWRHLGRNAAGLDCIGLVLVAARAAGVALLDPAPYAREPSSHLLRVGLAAHLDAVPIDAVLPGDVLVFNMGIYAAHVGLAGVHPAYRVPSVVHALLPRRRVVEEVLAPVRNTMTGAYRWREG